MITPPLYQILKNDQKNKELINKGYIVLPMLNEKEVSYFKALYKKWHPTAPSAFYKSYFSDNEEYKAEVENAIMEYCLPKLENYFVDYEAFGAMFVVKPPGDKGHIPPHQDWSFVDETKHWSLNMWLPIQETNERNGTMRFLTGSHFFMESVRGANTPELYTHLVDEIEPKLVETPLMAGEAVFFYHGIVHCSHFNNLEEERVCLGLSLLEKEAPIYFHLLLDGETKPEKYQVNNSFYINYAHNRGKIPNDAIHLGKDDRSFSKLTKEELEQYTQENTMQ